MIFEWCDRALLVRVCPYDVKISRKKGSSRHSMERRSTRRATSSAPARAKRTPKINSQFARDFVVGEVARRTRDDADGKSRVSGVGKLSRKSASKKKKVANALRKRLLRQKRASDNATRWRVGLRARAPAMKATSCRNLVKAVTAGLLHEANAVKATWLNGAGVTIATERRSRMRVRTSAWHLERLSSFIGDTSSSFWENHPDFVVGGDATSDGDEPKRDPFVQWMCRAKELAPDVFSREMSFAREFSRDGARPFTTAIRMIDEWTTSSLRRLHAHFPGCVDDSWRTGIPRDIPLLPDPESVDREHAAGESENVIASDVSADASANALQGFVAAPMSHATPAPVSESGAQLSFVAQVAAQSFALDAFPILPLEILPVEHFVLGLWSSKNATTPGSPPSKPNDTFSLPWLDSAWIDLMDSTPKSPRKQRARVWRGKNLDMIVYGEDEKQTWASKIAAFLKRARSALGNRVLDRGAWGGSILDSLIGANLTQNVSDVLSSTAFMNLAARFPYNASTAEQHDSRAYIHRIVGEMFDRIREGIEPKAVVVPDELPGKPIDELSLRPKRTVVKKKLNAKKAKKGPLRKSRKVAAGVIEQVLARPDPPRTEHTTDQVDWYAVLDAPLVEIVKCIRCRGMHWMLARRIKGILKRVMAQRGCLSLEFLRDTPTRDANEYLLALDGMGVKTTSCVLLLALHRTDFPVDVNVGRIMARLGWVPLESETALEELAQYAPEPAVYTFLRERLNSFGVEMLYELHYHMITLGKVFCGKRLPNCGACPLRDVCEYAKQGGKCVDRPDGHSGLASLQPELPTRARPLNDIEDIGGQTVPRTSNVHENVAKDGSSYVLKAILAAGVEWDKKGRPEGALATNVLLLSAATSREDVQLAYVRLSRVVHPDKNSHPDASLAFNYITMARKVALNITNNDTLAQNIEAELEEMIRLSVEDVEEVPMDEFTGMELSETVIKASKVRAETLGWSVPTTLLPRQIIDELGGESSACGCIMVPLDSNLKSLDEITAKTVDVAILVPCISAMKKKFPLHGTYFQVNEVFLDEVSSNVPLKVEKTQLSKCKRIRVLVGTSIGSIARGMSRVQVTAAFASQRICVRTWNRTTKRPGPLPRWLCPFFPQPVERPLEPEPSPLTKDGRPMNPTPLSPVSVLTLAQSPQIATMAAAAPVDSVEHRLLEEFQRMFKGKSKPKMPPGLKRAFNESNDGSSRKRRALFPKVLRHQKCGFCRNCLNPSFKQACLTRRNQMRLSMASPTA